MFGNKQTQPIEIFSSAQHARRQPSLATRLVLIALFSLFGGIASSVVAPRVLEALHLQSTSESVVQAEAGGLASCTANNVRWEMRGVSESYNPGTASTNSTYTGTFEIKPLDQVAANTQLKLEVSKFFCPRAEGQDGGGNPSNGTCGIQWYLHTRTGERVHYSQEAPVVTFAAGETGPKTITFTVNNAPAMCGGFQIDSAFDQITTGGNTTQCTGINEGNLAHATCTNGRCDNLTSYTGQSCSVSASCPANALNVAFQNDGAHITLQQNLFVNTSLQPAIVYRKTTVGGSAGEWQHCEFNTYSCTVSPSFYAQFGPNDRLQVVVNVHLRQTSDHITLNVCTWDDGWDSGPQNNEYFLGSCTNNCNKTLSVTVPT
ncbi:hypothetical protein KC921_02050, partial [Candidatus Woesebacteria bacterium]|nr:hypothetical protein [Candidatus Woesebacteria bacterium]